MGDLDTASLLFSFPNDIVISSVRASPTEVVLQIACRRTSAACPLCQQSSERVHGHYGRTVADLPCAGRRVILALKVRKFEIHPDLWKPETFGLTQHLFKNNWTDVAE